MAVLLFFGFFVSYALRINISVAIVAMVNHTALAEVAAASTHGVEEHGLDKHGEEDVCMTHLTKGANRTDMEPEEQKSEVQLFYNYVNSMLYHVSL